jgi:hypothetical protein
VTAAQRDALAVLVQPGRRVRGGKRRSSMKPIPAVNTTAALRLVDDGYAKLHLYPYASLFSSGYEFTATDKGRAALPPGTRAPGA